MICKNCEAPASANFCANCGQKTETHRLTFAHVMHEFFHAFTHADKGILLLIIKLISKPGIVAKEYIEGKRKRYFNPLSFIVITSAVHASVSYTTDYYSIIGASSQRSGGGRKMPAIWLDAFKLSEENGKIITLLLIVPLLAFISWVFFKRTKHFFAEIFVLNSFIVGESHVVRTLLFIPLALLFPQYGQLHLAVFEIIFLTYIIIAYKQFFNQNIFLTILKGILTLVLFIILYWVFLLGFAYLKNLFF